MLRRFLALDRADRRLVCEAAILLAAAWTGLRVFRFAALRERLDWIAVGGAHTGSERERTAIVNRVRWAIGAAARRVPAASCLVQALAADIMLRRRGIECQINIGVRTAAGSASPIAAHAWVECGGAVVLGAVDDLDDFTLLTTLRPREHR